jgi:alanyl-tRNA synthetase
LSSENLKVIDGEAVFKLYDTFGFPVDLTNVMAKEQGFEIDEAGFNTLMNEQKKRARKSTKDRLSTSGSMIDKLEGFDISSTSPTEFVGYESLKCNSKIIGCRNDAGKSYIILDKTPFYVESGGQVGDLGNIIVSGTTFNVIDVAKTGNQIIHIVENENKFDLINGMNVSSEVDYLRRWDIMRNHSATHFLHKALRQIIGQHIQQSGSYVGPDRLRFDFTHYEKLSDAEIDTVENLVNDKIRENLPLIHHRDTPFEKAKGMGALMFFGDKYGDKVNIVQFGDFTMEFCGGTHVKNGSEIGLFKIVSESSIASGVRRIEGITGAGVDKYIRQLVLNIQGQASRIEQVTEEKKKIEKQLSEFQLQAKLGGINQIIENPEVVKGVNVFKGKVAAANMDELKSMGDELRDKMKNGIGVLISEIDGKVGIVAVVSDDLIKEKKILAGNIVKEIAKIVGGSGGGRPHLATAGGKDISKIDEALNSVLKLIT